MVQYQGATVSTLIILCHCFMVQYLNPSQGTMVNNLTGRLTPRCCASLQMSRPHKGYRGVMTVVKRAGIERANLNALRRLRCWSRLEHKLGNAPIKVLASYLCAWNVQFPFMLVVL
jgi:hypothetical protein